MNHAIDISDYLEQLSVFLINHINSDMILGRKRKLRLELAYQTVASYDVFEQPARQILQQFAHLSTNCSIIQRINHHRIHLLRKGSMLHLLRCQLRVTQLPHISFLVCKMGFRVVSQTLDYLRRHNPDINVRFAQHILRFFNKREQPFMLLINLLYSQPNIICKLVHVFLFLPFLFRQNRP